MPSIAELLLAKAQQQGQMWNNIGRDIAAVPATIAQAQEQGRRSALEKIQLQNVQQQQQGQQVLDQALTPVQPQGPTEPGQAPLQATHPYLDDQGLIDPTKVQQLFNANGLAHVAPDILDRIDKQNSAITNFQKTQEQLKTQHAILLGRTAHTALGLMDTAGLDFPTATTHAAQSLVSTGVLKPEEIQGMIQQGAQLPPDQQRAVLASLVDQADQLAPTKTLAEGAKEIGGVSGRVLAANQKTEKPTEAEFAAIANDPTKTPAQRQSASAALAALQAPTVAARDETARHNAEMERISKLTEGREAARDAEIARHNRETERANNPLAALTGGTSQSPTSATAAEGQHGDDFLKTLPPSVASEVKAYAEGRRPFPAGFALKSPYFQSLIQMVGQYDPTFDAVNYNARSKTRNDFTSGKSAQTINALNTVTQHLNRLSDSADALNNSWSPVYNSIANFLSKQSGSKQVTQFETDKKAVVDELTRAWRQAGGSEGDIKSWSAVLDAANSPTQLHGAIAEMGQLLEGKLSALEAQYQQGMGTTDTTGMKVVTPEARTVLSKLEQRAGGGQQGPKEGEQRSIPSIPGGVAEYRNGKWIRVK